MLSLRGGFRERDAADVNAALSAIRTRHGYEPIAEGVDLQIAYGPRLHIFEAAPLSRLSQDTFRGAIGTPRVVDVTLKGVQVVQRVSQYREGAEVRSEEVYMVQATVEPCPELECIFTKVYARQRPDPCVMQTVVETYEKKAASSEPEEAGAGEGAGEGAGAGSPPSPTSAPDPPPARATPQAPGLFIGLFAAEDVEACKLLAKEVFASPAFCPGQRIAVSSLYTVSGLDHTASHIMWSADTS